MTLLRTHGTLIDRTLAEALKAAGRGRALVDLMGAERKTHDWFTADVPPFLFGFLRRNKWLSIFSQKCSH